jgi:uncharacterized protein (TIGR02996 family)
MTDREMLLAAICANPDEDTPRLAFADWLQEQGGKDNILRADYIRRAIRLAREELFSPAWKVAEKAWDKVNAKVQQRLVQHWVAHLKGRAVASEFDRGFVGHITVHSKRFVAEGEKFFAQDPICSLKFVTLASARGTVPVEELFACPHLAHVAKLNLDESQLKDSDLAVISASRHLAKLRSISLRGFQRFNPKGFVKLLQELPALSEVQMASSALFDNRFATALAASPSFKKLTVLNLPEHYLDPKGLAAILATKHGANLRELRLSVGYVCDPDEYEPTYEARFSDKDGKVVAAVLGKARFPNLRFLDLGNCMIGDAGLVTLVKGGGFPLLRQLSLNGNDVSRDSLKVLAESSVGQQLVYLSVGFSPKLENPKVMKEVCKMFPNARVEGYGIW